MLAAPATASRATQRPPSSPVCVLDLCIASAVSRPGHGTGGVWFSDWGQAIVPGYHHEIMSMDIDGDGLWDMVPLRAAAANAAAAAAAALETLP